MSETASGQPAVVDELQTRLGGPIGTHASRRGLFFNPALWAVVSATITWLVCVWHQTPCRETTAGKPVNALLRLCYSDIPVVYQNSGMATGQMPYRDFGFDQAPVTAAFMLVARSITRLLGFRSAVGVTPQQELDASNAVSGVTAVLLYLCLLVLVLAHVLLGRRSSSQQDTAEGPVPLGVRVRSWDAILVAGAPVVAAAGLVNYDLLAAALVGAGLLAWALRRPGLAGVLLGLGISTKFYPVFVVVAIVLLCLRAGRRPAATRLCLGALGAWLVTNLPVLAVSPGRWLGWYVAWTRPNADLGSVWFLLGEWGVKVPRPGVVGALLMLAVLAYVAQQVLQAPRRPRVGQVAFLLVAGLELCDKGYPPQHVVWLLPLLVLARPVFRDWASFTVAELLYFWAVWGHLNGQTAVGSDPDVWYWMATMLRIGVLAWLFVRVVRDIQRPWTDPVRQPFVDDPVGGVLDHAPDAMSRTDDGEPAGWADEPDEHDPTGEPLERDAAEQAGLAPLAPSSAHGGAGSAE